MSKVKVEPKQLFEKRNTSDVFTRLIIMGLLRILNMKLKYTQVWEDDEEHTEEITVPFFYDFSGGSVTSERFIQDNYLNFTDDECTEMGLKKIDGDFKPIPYGVITLGSTSIDAGNISNRFVMGQYQKRENNALKSYVSFLYSIPLTYSFTISIKVDTMNTLWKIEQAIREYFYKNKTFHVNYKGTVVPARVGFPESISNEKNGNYQIGQANDGYDIKMSFDIACETYQPVFDPYNEMEAEHNIKQFGLGIGDKESMTKEKGDIIPVTYFDNKIITAGQDIFLEWKYFYNIGDLLQVQIGYETEDGQQHQLETVENHNFYYWTVPDDIISDDNIIIDVYVQNNDECKVYQQPFIKFLPNPNSNIIDKDNVVVINKGMFITDLPEIIGMISYEDKHGNINETEIIFNIKNGMIDEDQPVACMNPFKYDKEFNYKKIKLYVKDTVNNKFTYLSKDVNNWITVL